MPGENAEQLAAMMAELSGGGHPANSITQAMMGASTRSNSLSNAEATQITEPTSDANWVRTSLCATYVSLSLWNAQKTVLFLMEDEDDNLMLVMYFHDDADSIAVRVLFTKYPTRNIIGSAQDTRCQFEDLSREFADHKVTFVAINVNLVPEASVAAEIHKCPTFRVLHQVRLGRAN